MNISDHKNHARKAAFQRRKIAFESIEPDLIGAIRSLTEPYQNLAFYMPMRTEIDVLPAMTALSKMEKTIAVPVIIGKAQPLEFYEWTPEAKMEEGEFGALIPQSRKLIIPEIIFAPLVAFDDFGTRLGYGGGFYDRTIAKLRSHQSTPYIGVAFEAQLSSNPLPREETDIPLDGIITENGYRAF